MRNLLRNGYTVYINKKEDKINGIGLKKGENGQGIITSELDSAKIKVLGKFPGIDKKLSSGETLQISRNYEQMGIRYKAQLGRQVRREPYGETDGFEVTTEVEDEDFLGTLFLLNEASMKDEEITPPKVLIRAYGEATYK